MAAIEAEPRHVGGNVRDDALDLIGKFDIAAGMGMNGGTYAMLIARQLRDGANVRNQSRPARAVEPWSSVRMAGGIVAFVVPPIHDGEIGRVKTLSSMGFRLGQLGDERADLVGLAQQIFSVCRVHQIIEDRPGDNPEFALVKRFGDAPDIEGHIAVRSKLKAAKTSFG